MVDRKKKLPVGTASFSRLRNNGCYYVDKTSYIEQLIEDGDYYFLSRPRRFGKSLLISTLKELFEGNEPLFRGLHIHDRWDWAIKCPVVRLSFDTGYGEPQSLHDDLLDQLAPLEDDADIDASSTARTGPGRLRNLIVRLHQDTGQRVVVLVDEYDKPILDQLHNPQQAETNRQYLHGVYSMLKGCADQLCFVFVTGISMYSKVSLFSGMNNLRDISLNPEYATLCGYTDRDIDTVFAPELAGLDRSEMQRWYNGYHWLGQEKVYNPFDILLLFAERQFEPYWYATGTPSYLHGQLARGGVNTLQLENLELYAKELSNFNIDDISINALLFQCGYLTIRKREMHASRWVYTLTYPNLEVRISLNEELLEAVCGANRLTELSGRGQRLIERLDANDFDRFQAELHAFFSAIPHQWHDRSDLARYEAFFTSVLYSCFVSLGVTVTGEESSSHGRADLVVTRGEQVFILECKMQGNGTAAAALAEAVAQLREKKYANKYRAGEHKVHLLAMVFEREDRNLVQFSVESL